jgi:hypothetical protein
MHPSAMLIECSLHFDSGNEEWIYRTGKKISKKIIKAFYARLGTICCIIAIIIKNCIVGRPPSAGIYVCILKREHFLQNSPLFIHYSALLVLAL